MKGEHRMSNLDKLNLLENRYNRLASCPKDWKCPGVVRKLARQIRNLRKLVKA